MLSEQVISDGKPKTVKASADTIEAAFTQAQSKMPIDAKVLEKKLLTTPEQKVIIVEASDEASARVAVWNRVGPNMILKNLKLVIAGKKGFLGVRAIPNQYEANLLQQAFVEIIYKMNAKISAKIDEKKKPEKFGDLLEKHIIRLKHQSANQQGFALIEPGLSKLLRFDILSFTTNTIEQQMKRSLQERRHHHQGQKFEDIYMVISTIPVVNSTRAMTHFVGGYFAFIEDLFKEIGIDATNYNLAHWIVCQDIYDEGQRAVHLTFLPAKNLPPAYVVLALDLMTTAEKSKISNLLGEKQPEQGKIPNETIIATENAALYTCSRCGQTLYPKVSGQMARFLGISFWPCPKCDVGVDIEGKDIIVSSDVGIMVEKHPFLLIVQKQGLGKFEVMLSIGSITGSIGKKVRGSKDLNGLTVLQAIKQAFDPKQKAELRSRLK